MTDQDRQARGAAPRDRAAMTLKRKLAEPDRTITLQMSVVPSPVTTQAIAMAGMDAVVIDQEHGPIDFGVLHAMVAATQGTGCAPLVRVPEIGEAHVKRALDAGAEGICFPLARTRADVEHSVASLRYPPEGRRGWGPFVAHSRWGVAMAEYADVVARDIVCMLLIETAEAIENIDDLLSVEGVDCAILATFDLSAELGVAGRFDHPRMISAVEAVERAAARARMPLGAAAFSREQAHGLRAKGYRILGGFDVLSLKGAVSAFHGWATEDLPASVHQSAAKV